MKPNEGMSPPLNKGLLREMGSMLSANVRDYAMYIALVVIFIFFSVRTDGNFLSPGNFSNLIKQSGYVAVLAIGMTLVLIVRHIDLSVGFVAGFTGAVVTIFMTQHGMSEWIAIPLTMLVGLVIGLYQGTMIAYVGIPAFVITLAGMFIFRGLLALVLQGSGTIIVPNKGFNALASDFIPDIPHGGSFHLLTILLGALCLIVIVVSAVRGRMAKRRYHFVVTSMPVFVLQMAFYAAIIGYITYILASDQGVPWTMVIIMVIMLIYNFILNRTRLGRYIYGIGGNPEASMLSGINVKKVTLFVFASMGVLAAVAGILYTSRLKSATPQAGLGFELDAIASSYIGGVAVSGGVGKVTNTLVGALVIMSLSNGMNLLQVDISYQYIVKGVIFTMAVAFDILTRKNK